VAVEDTEWSVTGGVEDIAGVAVALLRRQTDGSWLLLIDDPFAGV
jgi:ketosteroid isomerase-like protein